jgi:hypothetical protein
VERGACDVRTSHFVKKLTPGQTISTEDVQEALPTVGVLLATWGAANVLDDNDGRHEAWMMLEAAGLSTVTAYGFKYVSRREGPDQASDADEWFKSGGKSFPSEHSTAASLSVVPMPGGALLTCHMSLP